MALRVLLGCNDACFLHGHDGFRIASCNAESGVSPAVDDGAQRPCRETRDVRVAGWLACRESQLRCGDHKRKPGILRVADDRVVARHLITHVSRKIFTLFFWLFTGTLQFLVLVFTSPLIYFGSLVVFKGITKQEIALLLKKEEQ